MSVLDMVANPSVVIRLRIVVYAALVFFSFFIFIGVAVMKDTPWKVTQGISFSECPLYCELTSSGANFVWDCGSASNCDFPMAIAIMFQLLFLLFRVGTLVLLLLGKLTSDFVLFQDMMEVAYIVTEFFGFFFTFIGACILSAGFNTSCDSFNCDDLDYAFESPGKAAQAGAWLSTFLWLFVFLVGFLFLFRSGKIPFLGGSKPAGTTGDKAPPPQDIPASNPDDMPRY